MKDFSAANARDFMVLALAQKKMSELEKTFEIIKEACYQQAYGVFITIEYKETIDKLKELGYTVKVDSFSEKDMKCSVCWAKM